MSRPCPEITKPSSRRSLQAAGWNEAAALGIVRDTPKSALRVETAEGNGSVFEILFPSDGAQKPLRQRETRPEQAPRRIPPGQGHILVVDDEELVRSTIKTTWSGTGLPFLLSDNGHTRWMFYTQHIQPDLRFICWI